MIKKTTIASILCGLIMQSCMPYKQLINNDELCVFCTGTTLKEDRNLIIENENDLPIELITENYIKKIEKYYPDRGYWISYIILDENIYKTVDYDNNKNLKIISFSLILNGDNSIGEETHYDTLGNVVKVIDHRQANKYPICFKEALHIVEKKKAKRDTIVGISREIEIKKSDSLSDTLYVWNVFVDEPNPKNSTRLGKSWYYCINAKTGRLIRKKRTFSTP